MPTNRYGQMYTFAIEHDEDLKFKRYIWVATKVGDTVQKIASRRGHPEDARQIANLNGVRSVLSVLRHHPRKKGDLMKIKVPGELQSSAFFHVLAGDEPPKVTAGYQKLEVRDRPLRTGITAFTGFDPISMDIPIRFENYKGQDGTAIEDDIALLEQMAGRGIFKGAAIGPGAVIRIATTGPTGAVNGLIPPAYQYNKDNPSGPLWRIADIAWDDGALRDRNGNRIRAGAVVTVQQDMHVAFKIRSVAKRKAKKKH
jgi:hypothetical protein